LARFVSLFENVTCVHRYHKPEYISVHVSAFETVCIRDGQIPNQISNNNCNKTEAAGLAY